MKRICCPFIALLMAFPCFRPASRRRRWSRWRRRTRRRSSNRWRSPKRALQIWPRRRRSRHITRELTEVSQKTGIDITIDADVVLPETDAIPVARVQSGELDMQVMENIWKIVANGSGMLEDFPRSYYEGQASMWMELSRKWRARQIQLL